MLITLKAVNHQAGELSLEASHETSVRTYISVRFAGTRIDVDANELKVAIEALSQTAS